MATRVRTGNRIGTGRQFKSKSDWARALYAEGKTVAEVTRIIPGMGYAFAYGIADRAGYAETAAKRRATKTVATGPGGIVEVRIVDSDGVFHGVVRIDPKTGKVSRSKK